MGAKKYNEEQEAAWVEAQESWKRYSLAKFRLERDIREEHERRLKELKFQASIKANEAIDLGVTKAKFRSLISTNWNTVKEFLAIGKE